MGATRARRRSMGKRAGRREARRNIARVVELSRKGFSVPTIAQAAGVGRPAVEKILELAAEVEEAERESGRAEEGGGDT